MKTNTSGRAVLALAACALSLVVAPVRAEEQVTDFAAWAPADASVYVRLVGIADVLRDFDNSEFFKALKATGVLAEAGLAPDTSLLGMLEVQAQPVAVMLGMSFDELLDTLGSDVALTVHFGPSQAQPDFMLFLNAPATVDLDGIYERLFVTGAEGALPDIEYNGMTIHQIPGERGKTNLIAIDGSLLVSSSSLQMMEQAIDLKNGDRADSLASQADYAKMVARGLAPGYKALLYGNLGAIIDALPADPQKPLPAMLAGPTGEFPLGAAAAAVYVEPAGLTVRATVQIDSDKLNPDLAALRQLPPSKPWVLNYAPPETVLLATTKLDFAGIFDFVMAQAQMEPEVRDQALAGFEMAFFGGHSLRDKILPGMGPEVGIIACSGDESSLGDITFLVQLSDPEVGQAFFATARAAAGFIRMAAAVQAIEGQSAGPGGEQEPAATQPQAPPPVDTITYDGTQILYVNLPAELGLPEGVLVPSLVAAPEALVITSSLEAAKRAVDLAKGEGTGRRLEIPGLDSPEVSGLIYADPPGVGKLVLEVYKSFGPTTPQSHAEMDMLTNVLSLLGPVTLESRAFPDSAQITLKIRASERFAKGAGGD